jgi:hypothetical protein
MTRDPKRSLRERLEAEAKLLAEKAKLLPPGKERDALRRKAREMKVAARFNQSSFFNLVLVLNVRLEPFW